LEYFLAKVKRNLSISNSIDRKVWQLEKSEIFPVKLAYALIDDIRLLRSKNFDILLYQGIFPPEIEIFL
jgi:hypothetical protein